MTAHCPSSRPAGEMPPAFSDRPSPREIMELSIHCALGLRERWNPRLVRTGRVGWGCLGAWVSNGQAAGDGNASGYRGIEVSPKGAME